MTFQPHPPLQQYQSHGYYDSFIENIHDNKDAHVAAKLQEAIAIELSQVTAEEYQLDVLKHMEYMEMKTMPDIRSIEAQTEIRWFMRPYLLDFLLETHHVFQLLPETLHLAVNLLDRYCSRRVVYRHHYQLVGCAALLIALKYSDRKDQMPTIREVKSMCCSLYDNDMFIQMEWHMLQTLDWTIGHPTVTCFLQLALIETGSDPELEHMTGYISELALYHKEFIPVRPSAMATSALILARHILGRPHPRLSGWLTRYDPQVVINLSKCLTLPSQTLFLKYSAPHLSSVSMTVDLFLRRQAVLQCAKHHVDLRLLNLETLASSSIQFNP